MTQVASFTSLCIGHKLALFKAQLGGHVLRISIILSSSSSFSAENQNLREQTRHFTCSLCHLFFVKEFLRFDANLG